MRAFALTLTILASADCIACSLLHSLVGATIVSSENVDADELEKFVKGDEKTLLLRSGMTFALPRGTVRQRIGINFRFKERVLVIAQPGQRFQLLISDELHDVELVDGRQKTVKRSKKR